MIRRSSALARPADDRDRSTSTVAFGGLTIAYDQHVLVPRPWTVRQSRWAARLLEALPPGPVLELGAGAGHIGLAAVAGSGRRLVAVDQDALACDLARRNATQVAEEVGVRCGDLGSVLAPDERFALVLADPPWVRTRHVERHPADPRWAIDGGTDGLAVARRCLEVVAEHLAIDGRALLQLGDAAQVRDLKPWASGLDLTVCRVRLARRGALVEIGHDSRPVPTGPDDTPEP